MRPWLAVVRAAAFVSTRSCRKIRIYFIDESACLSCLHNIKIVCFFTREILHKILVYLDQTSNLPNFSYRTISHGQKRCVIIKNLRNNYAF